MNTAPLTIINDETCPLGTPHKPSSRRVTKAVKAISTLSKAKPPKADTATLKANMRMWATGVVGLTVVMSMVLNGYANSLHAKEGLGYAAWAMGVAIPLIVLGLSQLAGLMYRCQYHRLAIITGSVAGVVLALSVWHCSVSISLMTGSAMYLAVPMAIGIDAGLVCAKVAHLTASK